MTERAIEWERGPEGELVIRLRSPRIRVLPEESRSHIYAARKEMLLSLRGRIDRASGRIEEVEKPKEGKTKNEVE